MSNIKLFLFLFIVSLQKKCLLSSAIEYGIHRLQCRRDATFKLTDRDKKLTGQENNIIQQSKESTLSKCARKCLHTNNCITINFKKPNQGLSQEDNCQLLNILKVNGSMVTSKGWNHYEPSKQVRVSFPLEPLRIL